MVAADGAVSRFGDARYLGALQLPAGVDAVDLGADAVCGRLLDPRRSGVVHDGGVFAFDAPFRGAMGAIPLNTPVTGMVPYGNGYLMCRRGRL